MKKVILSATVSIFLLTGLQTQLKANNESNILTNDPIEVVDSAAINTLTLRLNEIESLDRSDMSRTEKKALRNEVKDIKSELKQLDGGGVYISASALLLIIILLIIFL